MCALPNSDNRYQSFTEICAEMRQELEKEEKLGAEYVSHSAVLRLQAKAGASQLADSLSLSLSLCVCVCVCEMSACWC